MQRRELLKAIGVVPFTRLSFGGQELDAVEVAPKKYWVFYDVQRVDLDQILETPWPWPNISAEFIPVQATGTSVQDAVAIYKLEGDANAES